MDPVLIILFLAALLGGLLGGWSGWGGWIVIGAPAWLLLSPAEAIGMAQPVALWIDLTLVLAAPGQIHWEPVGKLMLWAVPMLLVGALVSATSPDLLLQGLAAVMILLGVWSGVWRWAERRAPYRLLGSLAGIFKTTTGFDGPPLALALQQTDPGASKRTLGLAFSVLAVLGLPVLLLAGVDQAELLHGALLGMIVGPLAAATTWAGLKISAGQSAQAWVRIGQVLCAATALTILSRMVS